MWGQVLGELQALWPSHACREFLRALPLVDFQQHTVPQLEPLSALLRRACPAWPSFQGPSAFCVGGKAEIG